MLILLWGIANEDPMAIVHRALLERGAACVFLEQNAILRTEVALEATDAIRGCLQMDDRRWDLSEFTAVYTRAFDSTRVAAVAATAVDSTERRHAARVDEMLWNWCDVADCLVVNRPRAMASNDSKPYQLDLIRQFGFAIPDTLLTTDPQAVRDFWSEHGSVIYKSVSGVRSIVTRLGPEHESRLADVARCPTQFQAFVPGVDVRVHVVGEEVLACELVCQADDYRYRGEHAIDVRPYRLPPDVEHRCLDVTVGLGLSMAGIDLRRTPDGQWFCFEVNPMPGFSYFERASGLPIGAAVARLLMETPA